MLSMVVPRLNAVYVTPGPCESLKERIILAREAPWTRCTVTPRARRNGMTAGHLCLEVLSPPNGVTDGRGTTR
jgi:hypothetical protein